MNMNSAPHLLTEDRPEFERVLDEALRITAAGPPGRLNPAQLRTMALNASTTISACAAAEYGRYRQVREAERAARAEEPTAEGAGSGVRGALAGAGVFPVIAVLTPILSGTAALIFLLVGYVLAAMDPQPAIAGQLRTAGWLFLAIAAAGILFCTVGLVLTALRDGSSAIRASQDAGPAEVVAARRAWAAALLEHGMLPFLRDALADGAGPAAPARIVPTARADRPAAGRLGYSRPGFSSPGGEEAERPRFSSPDFSSPDYSGPELAGPFRTDPDRPAGAARPEGDRS